MACSPVRQHLQRYVRASLQGLVRLGATPPLGDVTFVDPRIQVRTADQPSSQPQHAAVRQRAPGSVGVPLIGAAANADIVPCPTGQFCIGLNESLPCEGIRCVVPGPSHPANCRRLHRRCGGPLLRTTGHFCQVVCGSRQIGRYQNSTGARTVATPTGKFQNATGQATCISLASPSYFTTQGVKMPCPPGKFRNRSGGCFPVTRVPAVCSHMCRDVCLCSMPRRPIPGARRQAILRRRA